MKKNPLILLVLLLFGISSCNSSYNKEDVSKIDELLNKIDESEKKYKETDRETALAHYDDIMSLIGYVKNYKDTLTHDEGMFFTRYKNVAKRVKTLSQKSARIETEIDHTRIQLQDLRETIVSGATTNKNGKVIDADFIKRAISEETLYANELIANIGFLEDNVNHIKEYYPKMKPEADSLIVVLEDKLKNK